MGVLVEALIGVRNTDLFEQPDAHRPGISLVEAPVCPQGLGDLIPYCKDRVERGHGLLEDHGDLVTADLPEARVRRTQQLLTTEADGAPRDDLPGRIGNQSHERKRRDRLPATRLADDPECLPLLHVEGDAVHGLGHTGVGPEIRAQVTDLEERHQTALRSPTPPCAILGITTTGIMSSTSDRVRLSAHPRPD